ncbi:hypothetical protein FQA39_LY16597 [Lamprigera yunnana]|nr:hypothetical protein FQA39_LY16597 [Lamprigera yunnana]
MGRKDSTVVCVFFLTCLFGLCLSARILVIMTIPLYSHQAYFYPLWRNLSQRGHELSIYGTHLMNDPNLKNITEYYIDYTEKDVDITDMLKKLETSLWGIIDFVYTVTYKIDADLLTMKPIKTLIESKDEAFDLVIVESMSASMYLFAEKFKAPLIAVSSLDVVMFADEVAGNVDSRAAIYYYNENTTLAERIKFNVIVFVQKYLFFPLYLQSANIAIKNHVEDSYPSVLEMINNIDLVFKNGNKGHYPITPLTPNVINVDRLNLYGDHPELSKELKRVLDDSKNGFIYVSLGTVVQSEDVISDSGKVFIDTFKELPYTVLWKVANTNVDNLSENVYAFKWFPQFNILKHANIKAFVTQGGTHSIHEAIHHQVPMICTPVYMDQFDNADKIISHGIGQRVDINNLEKEEFKSKILDVAQNPKYRENLKTLNKIIEDEPENGLDRAVFWTEYVIKNKGAQHLKSPLNNIPSYQYYLLDVIAVFIIVLVVVAVMIVYSVKLIICLLKMRIKIKQQ